MHHTCVSYSCRYLADTHSLFHGDCSRCQNNFEPYFTVGRSESFKCTCTVFESPHLGRVSYHKLRLQCRLCPWIMCDQNTESLVVAAEIHAKKHALYDCGQDVYTGSLEPFIGHLKQEHHADPICVNAIQFPSTREERLQPWRHHQYPRMRNGRIEMMELWKSRSCWLKDIPRSLQWL
jgi:hypothetical protein